MGFNDISARAAQALRILEMLESSTVNFKVARGLNRWVISTTLDNGDVGIVSGDTLTDALAQLAQGLAK